MLRLVQKGIEKSVIYRDILRKDVTLETKLVNVLYSYILYKLYSLRLSNRQKLGLSWKKIYNK